MTAINPLDVAKAMAQHAHNLGLVHYSLTEPLPDGSPLPLLVFGDLPELPIRAVSINVYDVAPEHDDELQRYNPLIYVQCRFREPGNDGGMAVADRTWGFFDAMHSETPGVWPGGVAPLWCLRAISGLPEFYSGTWTKADSYEIRYNPQGEQP